MSSDMLLELSKNSTARNMIETLGLPIPMPQDLRRPEGPRDERPIEDRNIGVSLNPEGDLAETLARTIAEAGGDPFVAEDDQVEPFVEPAEAFGRPATVIQPESDERYDALVMDATELESPDDLKELYEFYHPLIGSMEKCGRVLVIGRPPESRETPGASAAQEALQGFMRSLSKELGSFGTTANLLIVEEDAEEHITGPVRFLLSDYSAYINGQDLRVSGDAGEIDDSQWLSPLDGKVALVTGAARGIGAATSRLLAEEGAKVVCLDLPSDAGPVSSLARDINGEVLLTDVTDEEAHEHIAETLEDLGGADIVVNNAGITRDKTLYSMDEGRWDSIMAVNLEAVRKITKKLADDEVINEGGRVVCLSSIAGIAGNKGQTNYGASKAGVIGLVEKFSEQLADRNITVNGLAPGFIETRLTDEMPVTVREVARRMNNLSQGGQPQDVGQAVTFLSLPSTQGVTGEILRVCGGSVVGR